MGVYLHVPEMHRLVESFGDNPDRNKGLIVEAMERVRVKAIRDCIVEFRKLGNPGDDAYTPQHACANAAASTLEMKFPEAIEYGPTTLKGDE